MAETTFEAYRSARLAEGFDEVVERVWQPGIVVDSHTHPFSVKARVAGGEMWLTVAEQTQHLRAGDSFELDADVAHAERYGLEGATYWAARKQKR